jgi:hypothetical protein
LGECGQATGEATLATLMTGAIINHFMSISFSLTSCVYEFGNDGLGYQDSLSNTASFLLCTLWGLSSRFWCAW